MMEIDGEPHSIEELNGFREGLWMFKFKGIYYIIYPDDFPKRNKMRNAMSDNPFGPFKNNEVFVGSTDVINMYGSVVEYKGQWYLFYHNGNLSGTKGKVVFDTKETFDETCKFELNANTKADEWFEFKDEFNLYGLIPRRSAAI